MTDHRRQNELHHNVFATGHDLDDPMSFLNAVETALLAARARCPHCTITTRMLPMPGSGWGIDVTHETGCPECDEGDDGED